MADDFRSNRADDVLDTRPPIDLDPATTAARQRLLRPEPKKRSRHEPAMVLFLVVVAAAALSMGYLGGRNTIALPSVAAAPVESTEAVAAPATTTDPDAVVSTSIPATAPPTAPPPVPSTTPPTTPSTTPATVPEPVAPPSITDDFDEDFNETFVGEAVAAIEPEPAVPTIVVTEFSLEDAAKLATTLSDALSAASLEQAAPVVPEVPTVDTGLLLDVLPPVPEGTVQFDYKSSAILPEFLPFLDQMVELLNAHPDLSLEVIGHTDTRGDAGKNLRLSVTRAETVVAYIQFQGIDAGRLFAIGRGETEPLGDNNTEAGQLLNRRIQMVLSRNDS